MRRYTLRTLGERILGITLCSLFGVGLVLLSLLWALGLLTVSRKGQPTTAEDWGKVLVGFGFGGLALVIAWGFLVEPHEVRLGDDGSIEFRGMIGRSSTTVEDIQVIFKFVEGLTLESDDPRRVRLEFVGGSVVVSNIAELEPLLDELARRNPHIRERGYWPSPDS